ncbi:MAG: HAMP domain-containing histidine kinase [Alistipes sp.]|nr:HAMP domain-containing histidine kinase [Alistipes sp.]MBQ3208905.1 HAMP domain-containing histidine kinase [Alistipes sp.]MBQ7953105.1 HAMP domain-containing histidine kinase [Alistipes sp.]MBQ9962034.1 HAMP domain-containing histidine kinase [Alistipes sp.]
MGRVRKGLTKSGRVVLLVLGAVIVFASLLITYQMAETLNVKERHDVELWAAAMERVNREAMGDYMSDPLVSSIINNRNNIPFIITDEKLRVVSYHLIPEHIIKDTEALHRTLDRMASHNTPIVVRFWWTAEHNHIIFYGRSATLMMLYFFPFAQMIVIIAFVIMLFVAFRSSKQDEQNRVWIGLAKETAHQLGTPTSSLLGWIEYLRDQNIDPMAVEEMEKDLAHLKKIVDRFSKIGSDTPLEIANVNEVVGDCVMYFRKRIPRNVTLDYNGLASQPVQAMLNRALFEWVIENLLKNSLDALQGHGAISVKIDSTESHITIDVSDTGKGIAKSNWKNIFEPGFTTKTRGWGLGLSLSRRIVEEYHRGKIAVVDSVIGKGTTIRVTLKRAFE